MKTHFGNRAFLAAGTDFPLLCVGPIQTTFYDLFVTAHVVNIIDLDQVKDFNTERPKFSQPN